MKPGVLVRLPDGREGRVVYNALDGVGIKFDIPPLTAAEKKALLDMEADDSWAPDAILRNPYKYASLECVGSEFTIISENEDD